MWKVSMFNEREILDSEGYVIHPANSWIIIGTYDTIEAAARVLQHQRYLHDFEGQFRLENVMFN
jgi:hypothetical protein